MASSMQADAAGRAADQQGPNMTYLRLLSRLAGKARAAPGRPQHGA